MTYTQVAQIIYKETKKAGYLIEERKSVSTDSVYYTLRNGKCSLLFRVSDHNTKSNVITLLIENASVQTVENFIRNRIKGLGHRSLKAALGL